MAKLFEAWQIGDEYREWCRLKRPLRFGQWFMNRHKIEGHIQLFNETDYKKAQEYILNMEE
jgi:hypothetical protein